MDVGVDTEQFFELYDAIAVEVVDSTAPNTDAGLSMSNRAMAEKVCQIMGWEDFDMFESHDMQKAYDSNVAETCKAYAFVSFLRWRVFSIALQRGVGYESFNHKAATYSEYWYIALVERWAELSGVVPSRRSN